MKFHLFLSVFLMLILSSCSQRAQKPKPFLSEKKMVELLTDIQLTEAALQRLQFSEYSLDRIKMHTNAAYSELFEKYGINKESFEANLYYRTYHSRDLERIFNKVNDNLQRLDSLNRLSEQH